MSIDIKNTINKIYQYLSIYTVQTEQLKVYFELADVEHTKLLSHSKTRRLSLFLKIT